MKQILTLVILFSVVAFSCNGTKSKTEAEYMAVELVGETTDNVAESNDFNSFISLFKKVDLPFELKYGNFSDFNQANPGIDSFAFKVGSENNLPFETIDESKIRLWILGNGNVSEELNQWLDKHLEDIENDWLSVTSGICYENKSLNKHYVLINTYERISASNGGYYTEWLLEYDKNGVMKSCYKLGKEGYYSSRHIDFESGDGKFFLSCKSLNLKFINRYYVTVSSLEWSEMDGKLENDDYIGVGPYYERDGSIIYGVIDSSFSIKF